MNTSKHILIIGTGPAGLGAADAAKALGYSYQILEASALPFGHCKSFTLKSAPEIVFDEGPHISFTQSQLVQAVFAESAKEFHILQPKMLNFWRHSLIGHPPQAHLFQIPEELKKPIAQDIENRPTTAIKNYHDWLSTSFGTSFTELFPEVYTKKYWTVSAREMTTEWIGQRVQRPAIEDMLATLENSKISVAQHYFTHFRYPKTGGFQSFLTESLRKHRSKVSFNSEVRSIHPREKWVLASSGEKISYDHLISSIPLNKVVGLVENAPSRHLELAKDLGVTSVTLYSIIYRAHQEPASHWMYIYDEDIPFARLYFPRALVNEEKESLQAVQVEVYSSPFRSREQSGDNYKLVLKALEKMQILKKEDVVEYDIRHIPYANVLFNHKREPARTEILDFLDSQGICSVGRFGNWAYLWSDESYLQGQAAVERIKS